MTTSVSSHKCDECGVVYLNIYISEYDPHRNHMIVSVFILHLWLYTLLFSFLLSVPPSHF